MWYPTTRRLSPGHVLLRVPPSAVDEAIRLFERAGFSVVPGGPPSNRVNAMIYLDDGWFLELMGLAMTPSLRLSTFVADVIEPSTAERVRMDQSAVAWELSFPADLDLPFFKSPYRGLTPITASMRQHAMARALSTRS